MKGTKVHNAQHWLTACTVCKFSENAHYIIIMGMFKSHSYSCTFSGCVNETLHLRAKEWPQSSHTVFLICT